MSVNNPTPLSPRPRWYTGALATLQSLTKKKFREFDFVSTDEDPDVMYRGTSKNGGALFSNLIPIGRVARHLLNAVNTTATLTAKMIKDGVITSTTAAAVTGTLSSATAIGDTLRAKRGTVVEFIVDNTGPNSFTVATGAGITAATAVITGGGNLVVATNTVGIFKLYFKSPTTAVLYRVA